MTRKRANFEYENPPPPLLAHPAPWSITHDEESVHLTDAAGHTFSLTATDADNNPSPAYRKHGVIFARRLQLWPEMLTALVECKSVMLNSDPRDREEMVDKLGDLLQRIATPKALSTENPPRENAMDFYEWLAEEEEKRAAHIKSLPK